MSKVYTGFYKPKPGAFGRMVGSDAAQIGTGGRALTATATVSVQIPKPFRKCQIISCAINGFTAAVGSGAITAQLFKVVGGNAGTRTALTATFDLTSGGITTLDKWLAIALTGTDANNVLQKEDGLTVDLVAAGTVSTVPQAVIGCTWGVLD